MHAERGEESISDIATYYAGHDLNHFAQTEAILAARHAPRSNPAPRPAGRHVLLSSPALLVTAVARPKQIPATRRVPPLKRETVARTSSRCWRGSRGRRARRRSHPHRHAEL